MVAQALELSRKPHVVIATPGRLADHLRSSNTFSLKKLKFLVGRSFHSYLIINLIISLQFLRLLVLEEHLQMISLSCGCA